MTAGWPARCEGLALHVICLHCTLLSNNDYMRDPAISSTQPSQAINHEEKYDSNRAVLLKERLYSPCMEGSWMQWAEVIHAGVPVDSSCSESSGAGAVGCFAPLGGNELLHNTVKPRYKNTR